MRVAPVLLLHNEVKVPHYFAVRNPSEVFQRNTGLKVEFYTLAVSAQAPGNFLLTL